MTSHDLRVLFITRAYPPAVGGMETLSAEFTAALGAKTPSHVIANRYGKTMLPFFLPYAAFQLRRLAPQFDVIHLGDPLLTILLTFLPHRARRAGRPPAPSPVSSGPGATSGHGVPPGGGTSEERSAVSPARWAGRTAVSRQGGAESGRPRQPVAVTIHGLDILYPNPFYQALLHRFLPRVNLALCISRYVEREVHTRFPDLATSVTTPGIHPPLPGATGSPTREMKAHLSDILRMSLDFDVLLLTVARLVPRKGIAWFVESVMPALPGRPHLLVIGDGPERTAIAHAAARAGIAPSVTLAGTVPPRTLQLAYRTADIFVLPNIPLPNDAEGFGIVALEAAAAGLPVLAADLEGLRDAVLDDQSGQLVPAGDAAAWVEAVAHLIEHPAARQRIAARAPAAVREHFSWDRRADEVLEAFARLRKPESVPYG